MTPEKRLYPTLDLLRLVAITLTMMAHARGVVERVSLLRPIQGGLWLGVDLFMLISGWLLGGQLLRDASVGRFDPLRFYVKRWLRTLPPYYFMLGVLYFFGAPHVGGLDGTEYVIDTAKTNLLHSDLSWRVIATHLTFLQRYIPPNLYGVSWSLCVEEHFYLLLPLVVSALVRWPRARFIVLLVLGLEGLAIVCRSLTFTNLSWSPQQTHMRCDGLFMGLLLAWFKLNRPSFWARLGRVAPALGLLGIAGTLLIMASIPAVPSRWTYIGVPTAATWTLALLFLSCVHERSLFSRASFPGLRYLGELTYAIYLVHNVLPRAWLGAHSREAGLSGFVLRMVLVGTCSVLLHHLVERPALKLREAVLRRFRASPVVPIAAPRLAQSDD
jgi:peptidoglycan/LPS O-acetylase OafA/YrhL